LSDIYSALLFSLYFSFLFDRCVFSDVDINTGNMVELTKHKVLPVRLDALKTFRVEGMVNSGVGRRRGEKAAGAVIMYNLDTPST